MRIKNIFQLSVSCILFIFLLAACVNESDTQKTMQGDTTDSDASSSDKASGSGEYTMKIATATTNDVQTHIMEEYKSKLEEKTNGQINVEIYPSGQLGSNEEMGQQMFAGSLEAVVAASSFGLDELLTVLDIPYLWPDIDQTLDYINNDIYDLFEDSMQEKGASILHFYPYGPRNILSKKPLESISDFDGTKIRVQGAQVLVDKINAWGGSGIAMGVPELYTSLQQGVIDGIDNVAGVHYSGKYYENAEYLLMESSSPLVILFMTNNSWIESLPEDLQEAVRETASEIYEEVDDFSKMFHDSAVEDMELEGVEIIEPSDELHNDLIEASEGLVDEFIKRIPESEQIIDEVQEKFSQ